MENWIAKKTAPLAGVRSHRATKVSEEWSRRATSQWGRVRLSAKHEPSASQLQQQRSQYMRFDAHNGCFRGAGFNPPRAKASHLFVPVVAPRQKVERRVERQGAMKMQYARSQPVAGAGDGGAMRCEMHADGGDERASLRLLLNVHADDALLEVQQAQEREPVDLVLLLDSSGSMESAGRMEAVRRAVHRLLPRLDERDRLCVVSFASSAEVRAALAPFDGRCRQRVHAMVDALRCESGSNFLDALRVAQEHVEAQGGLRQRSFVLLLSDGYDNEAELSWDEAAMRAALGGQEYARYAQQMAERVRFERQQRESRLVVLVQRMQQWRSSQQFRLYALGCSAQHDAEMMQRLVSAAGDGAQYAQCDESVDGAAALEAELERSFNVALGVVDDEPELHVWLDDAALRDGARLQLVGPMDEAHRVLDMSGHEQDSQRFESLHVSLSREALAESRGELAWPLLLHVRADSEGVAVLSSDAACHVRLEYSSSSSQRQSCVARLQVGDLVAARKRLQRVPLLEAHVMRMDAAQLMSEAVAELRAGGASASNVECVGVQCQQVLVQGSLLRRLQAKLASFLSGVYDGVRRFFGFGGSQRQQAGMAARVAKFVLKQVEECQREVEAWSVQHESVDADEALDGVQRRVHALLRVRGLQSESDVSFASARRRMAVKLAAMDRAVVAVPE